MRILAIDGGGVRGILPALVLAELERLSGRPVHELFDLIAGSSAGGLVACAVTAPGPGGGARFTAEEAAELFGKEGGRIFRRTLGRSLRTRFGFTRPRYADEALNAVLTDYFDGVRLSDALTGLLVCSYDIERRMPVRFKSWDAAQHRSHDRALWQVARATIAAPTYFAPMRLTPPGKRSPGSLIDGGIVAHNPALIAAVEAIRRRPHEPVTIVSLGTGELNKRLRWEEASTWGAMRWARPLIDMFFDAGSAIVQEQLTNMLGARHHRFQVPLIDCSEAMDDASPRNLSALRRNAELLIEAHHDELARLAHELAPARMPTGPVAEPLPEAFAEGDLPADQEPAAET